MVRSRLRSMPQRQAFTLIELLVVIAIIAVLAALAATGTMRVIEAQNESNTRTAIQTAYSILQKQWAKVVADAKKETPSDAVYALAGSDSQRAQVIWVKVRLMEAFPISYSEINGSFVYQNHPVQGTAYIPAGQRRNMASYSTKLGSITSSNVQAQSSACLVIALSVNRGGAVLDEEKLGPFLKDTDGDSMKELVDGWGTPIAFFRFPTDNAELQKLSPAKAGRAATFKDPLDPDGTLTNSAWLADANTGQIFTTNVHAVYHAGGTEVAYIVPSLVSSGADAKPYPNLGLGLTLDAQSAKSNMGSPTAQSSDNICSFQLKLGGN